MEFMAEVRHIGVTKPLCYEIAFTSPMRNL